MSRKDKRYGDKWHKISKDARKQIKTCCYCLVRPAQEVHHVRYVDASGKLLLDNVVLGVDIFCVCDSCHDTIHCRGRWIVARDNKNNHNDPVTIQRLEFGHLINSRGKIR